MKHKYLNVMVLTKLLKMFTVIPFMAYYIKNIKKIKRENLAKVKKIRLDFYLRF